MSQTQMEPSDSLDGQDPTLADEKKPKSRKPPNTAFRQQRLKAWQPILTPKSVLPLLFVVGIIFAPIGGLLLYASSQVQEMVIQYQHCRDEAPTTGDFETIPSKYVTKYFKNSTSSAEMPKWSVSHSDVAYGPRSTVNTTTCHLQFYIPDDLKPPVLLFYRLTNFYQNHRRYVKSSDQDQLAGTFRSNSSIHNSDCSPLTTEAASGKAYYPCGIIANSRFNDTFQNPVLLTTGDSTSNVTYNMTNKGIAWSKDASLYSPAPYTYDQVVPPPNWRETYPEYSDDYPFPDLHNDEGFQNWMRTAGLPDFSKLALRNDKETMRSGWYQIEVSDYFPVNEYSGTKSMLLSTRTVMGGRNPSLGIAYVVVAGICIVLGAIFTATHLIHPRKLGDHNYLSWNSDQPTNPITIGRATRPGDSA